MVKNGEGEKPVGQQCRLKALMRWTGWTYYDVQFYVEQGRLRTQKIKPNSKARYYVASAQAILDGRA
jgi:hypothetical protein